MADIVVFISLTLDGVMQAPGRADEDRRGGFEHGGWAAPYSSPEQGQMAADSMATTGALLLGRRTYEDFYSFWPHQTDNRFTEVLNASRKYVASRTLREPLPWQNSVLLSGDAPDEVSRLGGSATCPVRPRAVSRTRQCRCSSPACPVNLARHQSVAVGARFRP